MPLSYGPPGRILAVGGRSVEAAAVESRAGLSYTAPGGRVLAVGGRPPRNAEPSRRQPTPMPPRPTTLLDEPGVRAILARKAAILARFGFTPRPDVDLRPIAWR